MRRPTIFRLPALLLAPWLLALGASWTPLHAQDSAPPPEATPAPQATAAPQSGQSGTRIPIPDIPEVKRQVREYYHSGQYDADIAAVVAEAHAILQTHAWAASDKPALVLDIDETSLSNWPFQDRTDFSYDQDKWKAWIVWAAADPIRPTLELVRYAREQGIAVFFITGRPEAERKPTEQNLREAGYGDWEQLYMKPDGYKGKTVEFKTGSRQEIEKLGFRIVLNLGDQQSDLDGGHADKTLKLPNPFYRNP